MKKRDLISSAMIACVFVSCSPESKQAVHEHSEMEDVFHAEKGICLTLDMMNSMKIKTAQAKDQKVGEIWTTSAQVYRGADESTSSHEAFQTGFCYASATVPETISRGFKVGQNVSILNEMADGSQYVAKIQRIDDSLRDSMGTVEVLLVLADPTFRFPMGSFLKAQLKGKENQLDLAVPISSVFQTKEGHFVYVKRGDFYVRTPIRTGKKTSDWVEVLEGIEQGEEIVCHGTDDLWLIELRATQQGDCCH